MSISTLFVHDRSINYMFYGSGFILVFKPKMADCCHIGKKGLISGSRQAKRCFQPIRVQSRCIRWTNVIIISLIPEWLTVSHVNRIPSSIINFDVCFTFLLFIVSGWWRRVCKLPWSSQLEQLKLTFEMASEMDDNDSNESSNIPQLKRKRDDDFICILQCGKPCSEGDSLDNISLQRWNSIQDKAIKWWPVFLPFQFV